MTSTTRIRARALLLLAALAAAPADASAQEVRLVRLVDDRTLLPDGSRSFRRFTDFALDETGNLVFVEREDSVFARIDGELRAVARVDRPRQLGHVELEGDRVFWSERVGDYWSGGGAILEWNAGSIREVIGEDTGVPGTDCTFWGGWGGYPDSWEIVAAGSVLFSAPSEDRTPQCYGLQGTYLWHEGVVEVLADRRSQVEDGGQILECRFASIDGDRIATLCGEWWSRNGLQLREADGTHARVVGSGDPIPGASTLFSVVRSALLRQGRAVFLAQEDPGSRWESRPGAPGIYAWDGASLSPIVDARTLPGDLGWWESWAYRFDGRNVAIHLPEAAGGPLLLVGKVARPGVRAVALEEVTHQPLEMGEFAGGWLPFSTYPGPAYAARSDGSLLRILGPGDVLDGRSVESVVLGNSAGATLAIGVGFSDRIGTRAIYAAELSPVDVEVDVRPRNRLNRIHPSRRKLVPVALLGSADFDVADVDAASLAFGPNGASPRRMRVESRDVNEDGFGDLVARFRPRETGIAPGEEEACLSGETLDGVGFEGCDAVRTVPRGASSR